MTRRRGAILLASLAILTALSGCFGDDEPEEDPPVTFVPAPPPVIPHNITDYTGSINLQARGPTGQLFATSSGNWPVPVLTTTNYTGLVVEVTWEPETAATTNLKLSASPEGGAGDAIIVAGPSPLRIAIDMTTNVTRSWAIGVDVDDTSNPAAAGANQAFEMTIGQYGLNHDPAFDPDWDLMPAPQGGDNGTHEHHGGGNETGGGGNKTTTTQVFTAPGWTHAWILSRS